MVPQQQTVRVCCYRCVNELKTETFTVMVPKCVPVQETVTCCRIVPRTVVKQVASCNPCETCCTPCCGKRTRHCH
jgi:hypothetical protein